MRERFPEGRHVWQMKRHVINGFRRWLPLEQRDRDAVVADSNAFFEVEFLTQPERALEPFRALLRIAHCQAKVTHFSERERNFHVNRDIAAYCASEPLEEISGSM